MGTAPGNGSDRPHARGVWEQVTTDVSELAAALFALGDARWQRVRLAARSSLLRSLVFCGVLLVTAVVLLTSTVLLLMGVAGGVAEWLGGRLWAGQLAAGIFGLLAVRAACAWSERRVLGRLAQDIDTRSAPADHVGVASRGLEHV